MVIRIRDILRYQGTDFTSCDVDLYLLAMEVVGDCHELQSRWTPLSRAASPAGSCLGVSLRAQTGARGDAAYSWPFETAFASFPLVCGVTRPFLEDGLGDMRVSTMEVFHFCLWYPLGQVT